MMPRFASLGIGIALTLTLVPTSASAQMTADQAREEGRALGNAAKRNSDLVPNEESQAEAVPGYNGTSVPQSTYFDDPDQLINDAQALKGTNEQYQIAADPAHVRPTFSNAEILATTARAKAVSEDPDAYLAGENISSASGQCQPLPPGAGTAGYYEATCNRGDRIEEQAQTCSIRMVPEATTVSAYKYFVVPTGAYGTPFARAEQMVPYASAGTCRPTGVVMEACAAHRIYGVTTNKYCDDYNATEYACSQEINDLSWLPSPITGKGWHATTTETTVTTKRVDGCASLAGDTMCAAPTTPDVCTEGAETRIIDGVPVTEACWAWSREYSCKRITQGNDCGDLEANGQCTYVRDDCLDDPPTDGRCKVTERVYRCPTPGAPTSEPNQFICGNDVYCLNGECEPIVREASTEFKDALVALHAIDQASNELDPATLRVFSGTREGCHKPIFGLVNCCAGKTSGAVTVAAGAAALAGGPAAIAALATPFLTMFACSNDEKVLDIKDRMGFCHKVGTYCSSSFLGICESKRTVYCCFESKLSRILQEQGRPQLGKPWASPKTEKCEGFTVDEFSRLDLSVMDFTEIYSDFVDAAKLPDEVDAMTDIQSKIQGYYELHKP